MNKIKIVVGMLAVMNCSVYGSDITVETDAAELHEVVLERKKTPQKPAITIKITEQDAVNDDLDSDDDDMPPLLRVLSPLPKKMTFKPRKPKVIPVSEIITSAEFFRNNKGPYDRSWSRSIHNATVVAALSDPVANLARIELYKNMLATQKPSPKRNALTDDLIEIEL